MTPEPLTKEKIDKIWYEIEKIHAESKDKCDREIAMSLANLYRTNLDDVKSAVDWLLKEIEKETNKYLDTYSHPDDEALRRILEAFSISITEKIKKSFEGVI